MGAYKKIKYVLTMICILLALIGIGVYFNIAKENKLPGNVSVTLKENTTQTLSTKISNIYPGSSTSYTIHLNGKNIVNLNVYLSFRDSDNDENQLKNYINVKVETKQVIIENSLKELLDDNSKILNLGMRTNQIIITYTMPESVGNEAKGAEANFYVDLLAKTMELR